MWTPFERLNSMQLKGVLNIVKFNINQILLKLLKLEHISEIMKMGKKVELYCH